MIYKQLKIKSIDETKGIITGVASAYGNYDLEKDRFLSGCNTNALRRGTNKMLLFNHSHDNPVGTSKLQDTQTELMIEAHFNMETTKGRDTFLTFKKWFEDGVEETGFSVGGYVLDYTTNEQGGWDITEFDLIEVSVVTNKANPNATMTTVKKRDTITKKEGEQMEAQVKEILDEVKALRTEIATLTTEINTIKDWGGTKENFMKENEDEETNVLDELNEMFDELNEQFEDEENENTDEEGEEE